MSDYISRDAAIDVIYGQHVGGKEACENARPNTYGADLREIVADIEDIPAADVRPRWIPVGERLPEEWWPVLGLIKFHEKEEPPAQQVLWYLGNGHWREVWRGDMIENDVTHWLPLPELPKEET